MRPVVPVALSLLAWASVTAQTPASPPAVPQTIWSTNVLGLLQFGPNVEVERSFSKDQSWGAGVRLPSLGLMSHVINDGIQGGWSAYGTFHVYPQHAAMRRWFVGPHLEFGGTSNDTYTSRLFGGGAEFGHRWIKKSGMTVAVGGLLGSFKSNDTWKDGTGSAGSETYLVWMLNVSLGLVK